MRVYYISAQPTRDSFTGIGADVVLGGLIDHPMSTILDWFDEGYVKDSDSDGISDASELSNGINPNDQNSDRDELSDEIELSDDINNSLDSDDDGLTDVIDPEDEDLCMPLVDDTACAADISVSRTPNNVVALTTDERNIDLLITDNIDLSENDGKNWRLENIKASSSGYYGFIVDSFENGETTQLLGIGDKNGYKYWSRKATTEGLFPDELIVSPAKNIYVASDGSAVFTGEYYNLDPLSSTPDGDYALRYDIDGNATLLWPTKDKWRTFSANSRELTGIKELSYSSYGVALVLEDTGTPGGMKTDARWLIVKPKEGEFSSVVGSRDVELGFPAVDGCKLFYDVSASPPVLLDNGRLIFESDHSLGTVSAPDSECGTYNGIYNYTTSYAPLVKDKDSVSAKNEYKHHLPRLRSVDRHGGVHFVSFPKNELTSSTEWLLKPDAQFADLLYTSDESDEEGHEMEVEYPLQRNSSDQILLYSDWNVYFGRAHSGQPHNDLESPQFSAFERLLPQKNTQTNNVTTSITYSVREPAPALMEDGYVLVSGEDGVKWAFEDNGSFIKLLDDGAILSNYQNYGINEAWTDDYYRGSKFVDTSIVPLDEGGFYIISKSPTLKVFGMVHIPGGVQ